MHFPCNNDEDKLLRNIEPSSTFAISITTLALMQFFIYFLNCCFDFIPRLFGLTNIEGGVVGVDVAMISLRTVVCLLCFVGSLTWKWFDGVKYCN